MNKVEKIAFLIDDEVEAIEGYDKVIKSLHSNDLGMIMVLREIRDDEVEHIKKLNKLLEDLQNE